MEYVITILEFKKERIWERIKNLRRKRRLAFRPDPPIKIDWEKLRPKYELHVSRHTQLCKAIRVLKSRQE